ncbi:IS982-like element ISRa1 family transposase [Riemerella anatipestifer]|uniref:IS982-like element ISRa1 family transposase n=1 Tax=Riemerella anatipestifer TaxID=34085 RepID=UPI000FDDAE01|nr:IS982-like element ISRa1 family transposase [Riemerella anatipestifer]AZZ58164.1 IS982-like element ISRa1 family transposase [Riemerella anatipestifer]AZZ58453.1 IS982-like element ISRa1 family transposase [Riemerella anatipestifer]AZZ59041.1 IS982-like element ISRa1 family transposase [Riemerella anatipestifer]MBT0572300.1 IS982-like element ISRa1 family transposase [Riemerella anatipestifer]MSN95575.1 IS982-like element ISRa1 family transposase [Riemerella anatipestifer]
MNNLEQIYERILEVLGLFSENQLISYQRRTPKMSDLEVISLNITAEYLSIDSELQFFRKLPNSLINKIERSVYNKRKRRLSLQTEQIRQRISMEFNEFEDIFIVDSMPMKVCENARSTRSKICKEQSYSSPTYGYCASQKLYFYGYKLHAVCSLNGVIKNFDISPASVHDIHYLKDIGEQMRNCTLIGDRGYLSAKVQIDLFNYANIKLDTPMRSNQKDYIPQFSLYKKKRKRIETFFSQLCDQFMIKRNYAKTFEGFKTRIISKITAATVIQYINKFIFQRKLNHLKISII